MLLTAFPARTRPAAPAPRRAPAPGAMGRQTDGAMTKRVGSHTGSYGVPRERIDGCPEATLAPGSSVRPWRCLAQPARGKHQRAGADRDARTGPPRRRTHTRTQTSPYAGDGAGVLLVSALSVRLGQDRRRGVYGSGAVRLRERHSRHRTCLCQQKMCNFLTRSTLLQQTDRAGMTNFLAPLVSTWPNRR